MIIKKRYRLCHFNIYFGKKLQEKREKKSGQVVGEKGKKKGGPGGF